MRMKRILISLLVIGIFFSLSLNTVNAQSDSATISKRLHHIKESASIIIDSLKLQTIKEYFTTIDPDDSEYVYLYVSSKDSVSRISPGRFYFYDTDPQRGRQKADSFSRIGYDIMLYLTAGTSGAMIHKHLFTFDDISNSFIMLHEAMHIHIGRAGFRHITYDYEESIGDVVGNAYLTKLFPKSEHRACKRFIRCNERVYKKINKCLAGKLSKESCQKKIYRITNNIGSSFQKERYQYTVNNAYLLRFQDYTLHYFELKKKFKKFKTLQESLISCFGKPYTPVKK